MTEQRAPLTPPDCDLRDFSYAPMEYRRIFASSFHARANDSEWRAGVTLWMRAFEQVPAGSLPADEIDLCRLAELGRDTRTWRKVRGMAMHGWVQCSDGRWYHPVVCEKVLEGWIEKLALRKVSDAGNAAKHKKVFDPAAHNGKILEVLQMLKLLNPNSRVAQKFSRREGYNLPDGENTLPFGGEKRPEGAKNPPKYKGKGKGKDKGLDIDAPAKPSLPHLELTEPPIEMSIDEKFEIWWKAFPGRLHDNGALKKVGKKEARAAFEVALKKTTFDALLAAARHYGETERAKFVKDAHRWLQKQLWDDETIAVLPAPPAAGSRADAREASAQRLAARNAELENLLFGTPPPPPPEDLFAGPTIDGAPYEQ